MGEVKLYRLY